jgi:hypothetical protein
VHDLIIIIFGCRTYNGDKCRIASENHSHLGNKGADWRIILKCTVEKYDITVWTGSEEDTIVGFCTVMNLRVP